MRNVKMILAMMLWAVTSVALADSSASNGDMAADQFKGYKSELEATYEDAASSLDESLDALMERMDELSVDLDGMVAQVQH